MKTAEVLVKKSNIHGQGVFAARNFAIGEVVLRWDVTNILEADEFEKLTDSDKRYVSFLNGKYIRMQEPEKFVNHACDANTTAKDFCDVATRPIIKGEEITANYREELPPGFSMTCKCGNKKCARKIIST